MARQKNKPNQAELWDGWAALSTGLEISGHNLISAPMQNTEDLLGCLKKNYEIIFLLLLLGIFSKTLYPDFS